MLMDSVGQESSQGRMQMACLYLLPSAGPQLEDLKAESLDPLKARSLACLVVDAGCWPKTSVPLHMISLLGLILASSLHGGWIPKVNIEKMVGKERRERNTSTKWKLYPS